LNCIGVGTIVSLQGVLTTAGTVVATSLDVIDKGPSPVDEVEGTIYPSNCNGGANFGMILSDSSITTSGSPLTSSGFGTGICLTVNPTASFAVDSGILTGQPGLPAQNSPGFLTASDLLAGQTVRAKITGAASGANNLINATATAMILRFSHLTGTVGTLSPPAFFINGLPTYITAFTVPPSVQTYTNATLFEGAADAGSLSSGATVSVAALFYNPVGGPLQPLQAAKVRQH
jgi:glucose dehydrogenase